ncbi:MAG: Na+/H+ antiporter NhaA [Dehalococcoidia bacterium]
MALTSHELAVRRARIARFVRPVQEFIHTEASGGIALLAAAVVALVWANSPWGDSYEHLLEHHIALDLGFWALDETLHHWINDGAMTLFFFLVGLEIKREVAVGELASLRRVVVPVAGAVGGMVIPVALFFLVAGGDAAARDGWGIAMATDIAFALGVLALLGRRIAPGLTVLLLAMAIVDDIGAILAIAIFYSESVALDALGVSAATLLGALVLQRVGIWWIPAYVALGLVGWAAAVSAGVHPTIVGVAFGVLTPWRSWYSLEGLNDLASNALRRIERSRTLIDDERRHEEQVDALMELGALSRDTVAPLDRLEHELHPFVAFGVVPLFAFANAGVEVSGGTVGDALSSALFWGIVLGLAVGKPVGIILGVWLAVRAGAALPAGVSWRALLGAGMLAGIGFTVSLLITDLAYTEVDLQTEAKLAIIAASLLAGGVGYAWLRALPNRASTPAAVAHPPAAG